METPKTVCLKFEEEGQFSYHILTDWDHWNPLEVPAEGFTGYVRADAVEQLVQEAIDDILEIMEL